MKELEAWPMLIYEAGLSVCTADILMGVGFLLITWGRRGIKRQLVSPVGYWCWLKFVGVVRALLYCVVSRHE